MKAPLLTLIVAISCGCFAAVIHNEADNGQKTKDSTMDATPTPPPLTHVLTSDTPYYSDGPQQARPPDGTLAAGTSVAVIKNQGSYTVIQTADGVVGYVSSAALAPKE